jgi:secreted trypsin-like serine protease
MAPLRLAVLIALIVPCTALANASPRIVGDDQVTTIADYPFQVALLSTTSTFPAGDEYDHQFCGGSILDSTHVITAAHCVYDTVVQDQVAPPASLEVLARTAVLAEPPLFDRSEDEQRVAVLATSFHPDYDPNLTDYDAAILTLAQPIVIASDLAQPISILGGLSFADPLDPVDVSGWGGTVQQNPDGTSPPQEYPHELQAVTTQIVDDATCNDAYDGSITPRMICAGEPAGLKDSCQGDSGGPLVADVSADGSVKDFHLVGIVSTGAGCAWPGFPGIYTRAFEPSIASFLTTSDLPQAPMLSTSVKLSGTPEPGQTLTCDPGSWAGNPSFEYAFTGAPGPGSTYVVSAQDVGRVVRCTVEARNSGGYGTASSAGVLIRAATTTLPPPPPPPPPPPRDTTAPSSAIRTARCRGTKCVLNIEVTDPPYTAGLGAVRVKARSVERVRCSRRARRRGKRVCTHTRTRSAKVTRLGGTVFTAVLRHVRPGRHTFSITATDAVGNAQAKPTRVTRTLRKRKR